MYYAIKAPPYPFFIFAGDALFRPGDFHRKREKTGIFDVIIVEKGRMYLEDNGENFPVCENEVLLLDPRRIHRSYKACDQETYFHWLHFSTTETYTYTNNSKIDLTSNYSFEEKLTIQRETLLIPKYQKLDKQQAAHIYLLLDELESLKIDRYYQTNMYKKQSNFTDSPLKQQQTFMNLLSILAIETHVNHASKISLIALQFIKSHYQEPLTLEEVAAVASCHPTHLIRCFKQDYSITPFKALTEIRIHKSVELLLNTTLTCELIAQLVGFSSVSYFSKKFKEFMGNSPQNFRRQKKSGDYSWSRFLME